MSLDKSFFIWIKAEHLAPPDMSIMGVFSMYDDEGVGVLERPQRKAEGEDKSSAPHRIAPALAPRAIFDEAGEAS